MFGASEGAATYSTSAASLVKVVGRLSSTSKPSLSFLDGYTLFGYPSAARDVLLTVLIRCMPKRRGKGVAVFDVEGELGTITFDYAMGTIELRHGGEVDPWWPRKLPKRIEEVLEEIAKPEGRKPAQTKSGKWSEKPTPRLRKGGSYELTKGKESLLFCWSTPTEIHKFRRTPRQKLYRTTAEALEGITPRARMKELFAEAEKKGFAFVGERRLRDDELTPGRPTRRTIRGPGVRQPKKPSKAERKMQLELARLRRQASALPKHRASAKETLRKAERKVERSKGARRTQARKELRSAKQKLQRLQKYDEKRIARKIRALERKLGV